MGTPKRFNRDGGPIDLRELDRMAASAGRIDKITVSPPLQLSQHAAAVHLTVGDLSTTPGGGANIQFVRITSWFVQDAGGKTTCSGSPSPNCYYPGVVQSLTCAGWADTGTTVWVVFTMAQFLNPVPSIGGGAPPTVVVVDGNTKVMAKDMGFTYAPDNGGSPATNPNNGESRPVWASDFYAAGVALDCDTGLTLGGES